MSQIRDFMVKLQLTSKWFEVLDYRFARTRTFLDDVRMNRVVSEVLKADVYGNPRVVDTLEECRRYWACRDAGQLDVLMLEWINARIL